MRYHRKLVEGRMLMTPEWQSFSPEESLSELDSLLVKGKKLAISIAREHEHTFDSLIVRMEEVNDAIGKCWGPVAHLNNVAQQDYPHLSTIHDKGGEMLARYGTELGQYEELYQAFVNFRRSDQYLTLSPAQKKIIDDHLLDFALSGVGLSPEKKDRVRVINERLTVLGNTYGNNIQEAQTVWKKHIVDDAMLRGVPSSAILVMRDAAIKLGLDGYIVTVHQPIYVAIMEHAQDRSLRAEVYRAYVTRASEFGEDGKYDNAMIMSEIVALRHEKAQLLGYENFNALSLARKMAGSVDAVSLFLEGLAKQSIDDARHEFDALSEFGKKKFGYDVLEPWDIAYVSEEKRKEDYDVHAEDLRKYFPIDKVFLGLFQLLENIYGVRFAQDVTVSGWRDTVQFFEMYDAEGILRGAVYADLFARDGKRPGAWMDTCIERRKNGEGIQIPVAYFNCNFTPPEVGSVGTLTHDEIETLFHEFGHVLHHLLSKQDYIDSGMSGVEWDAIEYPSQIMENWCWERPVLRMISAHVDSGNPITDELIDRLLKAKKYHVALFLTRQLAFGIFDWNLHLEYNPEAPRSAREVWEEVRLATTVTPSPQWNRFPNSFSHIFDGGYAAGYYSYLWAQVLAADVFEEFRMKGVLSREVGERFLHEILEYGSSRPMMESFLAFRGREPKIEPLLQYYGLQEGGE